MIYRRAPRTVGLAADWLAAAAVFLALPALVVALAVAGTPGT
ncbi:hypothetical protein [Streptomyces sp. NPDC059247]